MPCSFALRFLHAFVIKAHEKRVRDGGGHEGRAAPTRPRQGRGEVQERFALQDGSRAGAYQNVESCIFQLHREGKHTAVVHY